MDGSSEELLLVVDDEEPSPPLLHLRGEGETATNFLCDLCSAEFSLPATLGGLWLHTLEGREASERGLQL